MRTIEYTNTFKKDLRRVLVTPRHKNIAPDLDETLKLLAMDRTLPARLHDHPLKGEWQEFRECHIKPDLLLIYRKPGAGRLQAVRLGSHSELFR